MQAFLIIHPTSTQVKKLHLPIRFATDGHSFHRISSEERIIFRLHNSTMTGIDFLTFSAIFSFGLRTREKACTKERISGRTNVANIHFGNIGDLWKHLPLAEILSIEKPPQYWESHAGSAQYPLTHSLGRDYGVFHFLEHVAESAVLHISTFTRLLDKLTQKDGHLLIYPGSPFTAMQLLKPDTTRFLFCDTDVTSLNTIRDSARTLGILEINVECVQGDGISTLLERASRLLGNDLRETFVHIDPYHHSKNRKLAPVLSISSAA